MANISLLQDTTPNENHLINSEQIIVELLVAFEQSCNANIESFPSEVQEMLKYIHR